MEIDNAETATAFSASGKPRSSRPSPGLKAVDMFRAVADGRIEALWIMATNPVVSMPDAEEVERALRNCPFVVVSDVIAKPIRSVTRTSSFPRRRGEKRTAPSPTPRGAISRQTPSYPFRATLSPIGGSSPKLRSVWASTPPSISRRRRRYSRSTPLSPHLKTTARATSISDGTQISREAEFDRLEPFQWPQRVGGVQSARFFADGNFFTPDRKACFIPFKERDVPEAPVRLSDGSQYWPRSRSLAHDDANRKKSALSRNITPSLSRKCTPTMPLIMISRMPTSSACQPEPVQSWFGR